MIKRRLVAFGIGFAMAIASIGGGVSVASTSVTAYAAEGDFGYYEYEEDGKIIRCLEHYNGGASTVVIPSTINIIGEQAFAGNETLTKVVIPDSVTEIGNGAFAGCSQLKTVEVPSTVKIMGGGIFEGCVSLASFTFPVEITEIPDSMFWGCSALSKVEIPGTVKIIHESAFRECISLTKIDIPDSVEAIGFEVFKNSGIKNIVIPNTVKEIGGAAFAHCDKLESVSLPSSLKTVEPELFDHCVSLKCVRIPTSVTSIGIDAFRACESMETISVPASVKEVGWAAFGGFGGSISGKSEFLYAGTKDQWDKMCIYSGIPEETRMLYNKVYFRDVPSSAWYAKAVVYAIDNGMMSGMSDGNFAPTADITRAQIVVMLWNLQGQPAASYKGTFSDVPNGKYYTKAIEWAYAKGVVSGKGAGKFAPGENITRQEMAIMLKNYAKFCGKDVTVTDKEAYKKCKDAGEVSSYAVSSIQWAFNNGIMGGNGSLTPKSNCSRAEAATMMMNFAKIMNK